MMLMMLMMLMMFWVLHVCYVFSEILEQLVAKPVNTADYSLVFFLFLKAAYTYISMFK